MGTQLTVKCIEDYRGMLTKGKVYGVILETPTYYRIEDDCGIKGWWWKHRFEKPKETITFEKGDRVRRGPDWKWFNQDDGGMGTITRDTRPGVVGDTSWVTVKWDNGYMYDYRVFPEQDLVLVHRAEPVEEPVGEVDFECSPPEVTRQSVLEEAARLITGDRKADYGDAKSMHQLIGDLWTAYLNGLPQSADGSREPLRAEQVAMMMALMKIARSTSSPKFDTYVDLAGYSALAGEMATQG